MVSHAVGASSAEHWWRGHGAMVMHVRSQRAHRYKTLTCAQATRSGHLSTAMKLIVACRGHIVDRAPRGLDGPRLSRETGPFSRIHSSQQGNGVNNSFTPHDPWRWNRAKSSRMCTLTTLGTLNPLRTGL